MGKSYEAPILLSHLANQNKTAVTRKKVKTRLKISEWLRNISILI